jgi:hypothetical protein
MFRLEEIADELRDVVATLDAPTHSSRDAARLTSVAADIERLGGAAKVLFARRAVDGNGWRAGSDAILPEQWFARLSGCSESEARRELRISEQLDDLPQTEAKLREGEMRNLRAETERVVAAATDETTGHARAHRERNLRTWNRGFATDGGFSGPTEDVAVLLTALEPLQQDAFDAARKAGNPESRDAYLFDALISLARGALGATTSATDSELPTGRVRVDLQSLLDGKTHPGEVCDRTDHLERHHVDEFSEHRLTTYEILGRLCPLHHDLVTHQGYTVERHQDGSWTLHPPDEQRDTHAA